MTPNFQGLSNADAVPMNIPTAKANAITVLKQQSFLIWITSFYKFLNLCLGSFAKIDPASSNTNYRSCKSCIHDSTPFLWISSTDNSLFHSSLVSFYGTVAEILNALC
jgi:hypothetical protein